jgi:importin-5
MQSFEEPEQIKALTPLVDPILCASDTLLQKGMEQEAREILIDLSDIAELEPALFKPNYATHTTKLLQGARNEEFDSETRQALLELVVCVVKAKPGLMRKNDELLAALCKTFMDMLLDIEDTEAWHAAIEEQNLDDGAEGVVAAHRNSIGSPPASCHHNSIVVHTVTCSLSSSLQLLTVVEHAPAPY